MSSNVKFFIAAGAAFAVLLVAMIFLLKDKEETEAESSKSAASTSVSDTAETVYLNTFETADIKTVVVDNAHDEFTVTQHTRTKTDSEGNQTEEVYYVLDDYADILQDEGYLYTLANNLSCAEATIVEEAPENLSEYGFDSEEAATVTLKTDSDEMTIIIGDKTPIGGVYVKYPDSDTVYSVKDTAVLYCKHKLFHFLSKTVLEEPSESEYPKIERVTVLRQDLDYEIVFEYDITGDYEDIVHGNTASHIMVSPINAYLDVMTSSDYTHGIFGLLANDIYKVYPTEDELTACGFTDPYCSILTETDIGDIVVFFGDTVEIEGATYRYGYMGGINIIYLFNEENAPWLDMTPASVISEMIIGTYIYDIGKLTVESTAGNFEFAGSGDSESYSVTLDGEQYDVEMFKTFYQFLIKAPADTVYIGDFDETELLCSIDIELQNDYDGVISGETLEFYSTDGRTAVIVHNGVPSFSCNISYVNALLDNIERVKNGEAIVSTY